MTDRLAEIEARVALRPVACAYHPSDLGDLRDLLTVAKAARSVRSAWLHGRIQDHGGVVDDLDDALAALTDPDATGGRT